MKYACNSLCGMVLVAIGYLLPVSYAIADFQLSIDTSSLRQTLSGAWEIDANIQPVGPTTTIQSLLLTLNISPGQGQAGDAADNVKFLSMRSADSNPLFAGNNLKEVTAEPSDAFLSGSLVANHAVTLDGARQAFTLQFISYRDAPTTVQVGFLFAAFERDRDNNEGDISFFSQLNGSGNLTITGVPEPSTMLLTIGACTGFAIVRRRRNMRMKHGAELQ